MPNSIRHTKRSFIRHKNEQRRSASICAMRRSPSDITVTGTLGVLIKAKKQKMINELYPLLSKMKQNGFYITPALESAILKQADKG